MRHKVLAATAATFALLALSAAPATAVTNGTLDGEGHPYVGLMVAQDRRWDAALAMQRHAHIPGRCS